MAVNTIPSDTAFRADDIPELSDPNATDQQRVIAIVRKLRDFGYTLSELAIHLRCNHMLIYNILTFDQRKRNRPRGARKQPPKIPKYLTAEILALDFSLLPMPCEHQGKIPPLLPNPITDQHIPKPANYQPIDQHNKDPYYIVSYYRQLGFRVEQMAIFTDVSCGELTRALDHYDVGPTTRYALIHSKDVYENFLL